MVQVHRGKEPGLLQPDYHPGYGYADGDACHHLKHGFRQVEPSTDCDGHQYQEHRENQPVVDPALDIQEVPQPVRDLCAADDGRSEHRVGGAQGRAQEEGLEPAKTRQEVGENCDGNHGEREAQQQRPTGETPRRANAWNAHPHAIGEEHAEQRELSQSGFEGVAWLQRDQPQHSIADEEPGQEE